MTKTEFRTRPPSVTFVLLLVLLVVTWIAGGASRADVSGQVVVRATAWGVFIIGVMCCPRRPTVRARGPLLVLLAALLLALAQLVPLPPGIWQALPGRSLFASPEAGGPSVWRPLAIVPGTALNAAGSLIVPLVTLLLATRLKPNEYRWLPAIVLGLIVASTFVAVVQFSGIAIDNPLINDTPGERGGTFANRNHYALFAALGCLVAPAWAFAEGRRPAWRAPVALALVLVLALMILGSGSRAGTVVGLLALVDAFLLVGRDMKKALARYPRWAFPALIGGIIFVVATAVLVSVAAGRAVSVDRVFTSDPGQDMRSRGLPVVLDMIRTYFPWGSGLGGFDPIFRIHEPLALLKPTYFNHAHNDYLEIVLDAGLPGAVLLLAALAWWARWTWRAWRSESRSERALPRLGSSVLLLIMVASVVDYPARTPLMMAVMVIAALWLSGSSARQGAPALPGAGRDL